MFALRYPLAPDWEAVVREDTRWYLNLQHDTAQPVHPMIKKFREHLSDVIANELLRHKIDRREDLFLVLVCVCVTIVMLFFPLAQDFGLSRSELGAFVSHRVLICFDFIYFYT